jgi:hypothetical protein
MSLGLEVDLPGPRPFGATFVPDRGFAVAVRERLSATFADRVTRVARNDKRSNDGKCKHADPDERRAEQAVRGESVRATAR